MPPRPVVTALIADTHCNSSLGLIHGNGVQLHDGGRFTPSPLQTWLWERWLMFWAAVDDTMQATKRARLVVVTVGDLVEGFHHKSVEIVSPHPGIQHQAAMSVLSVPMAMKPHRWVVVRGTTTHVGEGGSHEDGIAAKLGAMPDPGTGQPAWWHVKPTINGNLLDITHHGSVGRLAWTRPNLINRTASQILHEAAERGEPIPDLAVRGHCHISGDSGDNYPTRVIQLPCWQFTTSHGHKVAPNSLTHIGGAIAVFNGPKDFTARRVRYQAPGTPTLDICSDGE